MSILRKGLLSVTITVFLIGILSLVPFTPTSIPGSQTAHAAVDCNWYDVVSKTFEFKISPSDNHAQTIRSVVQLYSRGPGGVSCGKALAVTHIKASIYHRHDDGIGALLKTSGGSSLGHFNGCSFTGVYLATCPASDHNDMFWRTSGSQSYHTTVLCGQRIRAVAYFGRVDLLSANEKTATDVFVVPC